MECLNNSDIKSSEVRTVWNIKLIMVYYWTYYKTLTLTRFGHESVVFFFSKTGMNTGIFVL